MRWCLKGAGNNKINEKSTLSLSLSLLTKKVNFFHRNFFRLALIIFCAGFFVFGFGGEAKTSVGSNYWKTYFSGPELEAVKKNAQKYTLAQIKNKSDQWHGVISGFNIKNGSVTNDDIDSVDAGKVKNLGDVIDKRISESSTPQDFSASHLTGTYAALNGSNITGITASQVGAIPYNGDGSSLLGVQRVANVTDFGATMDNNSDDDIAAFESAASHSSNIVVPGSGTYSISKFTIPANNITISCPERAIIKLKDGTDDNLIYAHQKSGITINNCVLDGNQANQTIYSGWAIYVEGSSNIKIENNEVMNSANEGIRVVESTEWWISNNYTHNNVNSGIVSLGGTTNNSERGHIIGNTSVEDGNIGNGASCISVNSQYTDVANNTVKNCGGSGVGHGFTIGHYSVTGPTYDASFSTFSNNIIDTVVSSCYFIDSVQGIEIAGGICKNTGSLGHAISGYTGATSLLHHDIKIHDVIIQSPYIGKNAISLYTGYNYSITDNIITGVHNGTGIALYGVQDSLLSNNILTGSTGGGNGINLAATGGIESTGNVISGNKINTFNRCLASANSSTNNNWTSNECVGSAQINSLVGTNKLWDVGGIPGGQSITGSTVSTEGLMLHSNTSNNGLISLGSNIVADEAHTRFGIGIAPSTTLQAVSTTEQLRLGYDSSNHASFTVGSAGALTIQNSGSDMQLYTGGVGIVRTGSATGDAGQLRVRSNAKDVATLGDTGGVNDGGLFLYNSDGTTNNVLLRSNGMSFINGGNVGIGTTTPAAALDVNGQVKIQKSSSQPFACDMTHDATLAVTSAYRTCICKGTSTTWVFTTDGTTSCIW